MRDRLFSIVDGEPIITAPLVNLKFFKELWLSDTSDDKHEYKKWMVFIYHTCDYRSDYFELPDKESEVLQDLFGDVIDIPDIVINCQYEYQRRNVPTEQRSLESAMTSATSINNTMSKMKQDVKQFDNTLQQLDLLIESQTDVLNKMTLLKEKMTLQERQMALIKTIADIVPKIEKNVDSIINLRQKVEVAVTKIQDSKDIVEHYMIDELISSSEKGEFSFTI